MSTKKVYGVMLSVLLMNISTLAAASEPNELLAKGEKIYQELCVHCHGSKADGQGHLVQFLKIKPADLTEASSGGCITKRVLRAVLGRHKAGYENLEMPLLKDRLSIDEVYAVSEYLEQMLKK